MNLTDINNCKKITIHIDQLAEPAEISSILKPHNVKSYLYAFKTHDLEIIKYGLSNDNSWIHGNWCDRVKRQVSHIPGWDQKFWSSSGMEMRETCETYFPTISKNDVSVTIWDLTNYKSKVVGGIQYELEIGEALLINMYREKHNRIPYGNLKDEANKLKKASVMLDPIKELFDLEKFDIPKKPKKIIVRGTPDLTPSLFKAA